MSKFQVIRTSFAYPNQPPCTNYPNYPGGLARNPILWILFP